MSPFRETIRRKAEGLSSCDEWLELVRDLTEPIVIKQPPVDFLLRWAEKKDLFTINALEGFVKETNFMEESLAKGDRCLILEREERICAFAWVTFRDFKLALWYTLKLPPGWSYLVYIFVHPEYGKQGVGAYLLGTLMKALRDSGCKRIISGMYSNWEASFRLHTRVGFLIHRRLTQCRLLDIFPYPPREEVLDEGRR